MPSNRWPRRLARALRDTAIHAQMRAEMLPRLPFVIALVVSAVALVVAIEHRPGTDARTVAVEEQTSPEPEEYTDESAFTEEQVELEIVEYGFSKVTLADGDEYVLVAVVVSNPYDGELVPGGLAIFTETKRGYPVNLDTMYIGQLPPHSTAAVGYVMSVGLGEVEVEDLSLEETDPSMLYPADYMESVEGGAIAMDPLPSFEFTGLEPLASPSGYRLHFTAEAPAETFTQVSVLFRDGEGRLLGGLLADGGYSEYRAAARTFPAGESEQYVDVAEEWIPEGADLDRIEISPSGY